MEKKTRILLAAMALVIGVGVVGGSVSTRDKGMWGFEGASTRDKGMWG